MEEEITQQEEVANNQTKKAATRKAAKSKAKPRPLPDVNSLVAMLDNGVQADNVSLDELCKQANERGYVLCFGNDMQLKGVLVSTSMFAQLCK